MFKRSNRFIANESRKKKTSFFSKITLGVALATFSLGLTSASAEESLSTVYHIYLDTKYMGSVNDQNIISQVTKKKLEIASENYKDLNLSVEDIEIIPEKMFRPVYDNDDTIINLNKELDVVVESTQLMINDEEIAHFNSKEEAESVLNKYKSLYVSEEELKTLELKKAVPAALSSLQEGKSQLLDVTFTEKVSLQSKKITPDKVLSVDQGLNLLKKGTLSEKKYVVKEEDVLGGIAAQHNLSLKQLLHLNPGLKEDSLIKPGDELNVTILTPFVKVSVEEEISKKETISFETEIKEDSSMPKGEEKTTQKGEDGEKLVHYKIYKENGSEVKRETISAETIKEPKKEIIVKGTKVIPSRGTGDLSWPAVGGYVSSGLGQRWGKLHKGIDIARPSNYTIKAADNGKVVSAGYDGGYGNKVVIDHNNGMRTVYAHLESISVSPGQVVAQGQKLGVMGSTGNSTGVHLHFEVYENGNLKNPMDYL
ncbi:peptidoglycan DD-metalloendopeptidase family protein [Metabacillus litoralis]|uniref:peptidoglycan DD-metalloendopeptidase family protein n=1 Tax=Metabacillus litoralis TaxID=152268 RepID=UPI001CFD142C|nr:M23 family metallopeptidase [Metabacillus litoralis]